MMWVAWRQHRAQIIGGIGVLVAVAAFLLVTGLHLRHEYTQLGLDQCAAPISETCSNASSQFRSQYGGYTFLIPFFLILPALAGIMWGAPLISRELEAGTHRLAWMQSVSRRRWFLVKVAMLASAVLVTFAIASVALQWWTGPLMATEPQRFDPGIFDLMGLVPVAYALAALGLGIAAGALTGRLLPALGLTIVAFLGLRIGVEFGLRPNFEAAVTASYAFPAGPKSGDIRPDGWMLSEQTLDAAGRVMSDGVGIDLPNALVDCPELAPSGQSGPILDRPAAIGAMETCAQQAGLHVVATYQPDDRYWRFQAIEAGIFLAVAVGSIAGTTWFIRRKVG
jgi:hypothetical protein